MAEERRKYERLPIDCRLKVNNLYNGYKKGVDRVSTEIVVFDISKGGIGFTCYEELPVETYFDATIGLNEREYFRAVVKILRCKFDDVENVYVYGAQFIGLAGFLENKVEEYAKSIKNI